MSDVPSTAVKRGGNATKSMLNAFTTAGWAVVTVSSHAGAKSSLSGSMTAGTLIDIINESGSAGEISQLSISNTSGSVTKTLRVVITVDGTQIYDFTSGTGSSGSGGYWAGIRTTTTTDSLPPIKYTNTIRVQMASSVTESNGFTSWIVRNQVT